MHGRTLPLLPSQWCVATRRHRPVSPACYESLPGIGLTLAHCYLASEWLVAGNLGIRDSSKLRIAIVDGALVIAPSLDAKEC